MSLRLKIKIGVMGSAEAAATPAIAEGARALGEAIARADAILFTGATTGVIQLVGKSAQEAGAFHIGISPGENEREHVETFKLPTDACDAIVYTGFGLKGRNVVLVRSCDLVIFIAGSIGSLNEFTIAHDEGKIIGCLIGTGGAADEIKGIAETFRKPTESRIFYDSDPEHLIDTCLAAMAERSPREMKINKRG
ncbi:MAG TPA: hypothetical protein VE863_20560 [Pyrinomonadaceae bacterium]|jgi:uncharacterized protein (TIGR00725 family)|nr:hypothetical protein [Pyrinomonadaceae bacterium]